MAYSVQKNKEGALAPFDEYKKGQYATLDINNIYTEEERQYRSYLIDRLNSARDAREDSHDEFDGMSYTQYYEANQKASISYVPPRKNKDDVNIVTGTTREKKIAIMSNILSQNFEGEVHAYEEDDTEDIEFGYSMGKMVVKSEQIESWDIETKLLAYDELTSQGNVFVEDLHVIETKWDKKKVRLDNFTDETFKTFKPEKKIKEVYKGMRRTIIPGLFVYLGNIKEFQMEQQPFLFTVEILPWEEAKALYGAWPRWDYVPKKLIRTEGTDDSNDAYGMNYRLSQELPDGWVEIVKYQDKWNDEYQIMLNGVMMLPAEFPMPWEDGEYSIVKGNLEPLSPIFAYCKSTPAKTKVDQEVLDEMYRLSILKTRKSFMPPIANYSANILSQNAFLPGKVHNELQKGEVEVLGGNPNMYSLQSSEISMLNMVKQFIDEKSINPIAQGQQPQGDPTATEVTEVQRQAKINMGLMMFGVMALHQKLTMKRISNILEHWTKATDTRVDKIKGTIEKKYMKMSVDAEIDSSGAGENIIEFTETPNTPEELADLEEGIQRDSNGNKVGKKKPPKQKRIYQLNPKVIRSTKYRWYTVITPTEKETSALNRVLFEDSVMKAANLFGLESLNQDYLKQKWATINHVPASKFFKAGAASTPPSALVPGQDGSQAGSDITPARPGAKELAQS